MQPLSKTAIAGLSAASTIAAVHAARQAAAASSSPARSSDIPRGTPSPVPAIALQPPSLSSSNAAVGGPDGGDGDGGGAINYVSSSDSSSPLSETYRPANECPASMDGGVSAAADAAGAAASKRTSDPKNCFKQVQFHLNNIALAAPLLKHKLGGSVGSGAGSAAVTASSAAAATTATTQARLLSQIPILRSVRKTRKKRKKVKPSEAAAAKLSSAEAQHQQQVLANLPPSKAFLYSCLSKASKMPVPDGKDIVYNGTFPIDQPLCSRFKNLSFSLSSTDTELDGGAGVPRGGGSDRCAGINPAGGAGEQMLRKRNSAAGGTVGAPSAGAGKVVKTFAIDEPI